MSLKEDGESRKESVLSILEGSHLVEKSAVKEKTFSGTIWDTPEAKEGKQKKETTL